MKAPPEVVFAQNLASNDKVIRDRAVKKLKKWLGSRAVNGKYVSEEEMMKIWKGLHYCYWMSDKPLIQEELADNIANIVACFKHEESSLCFFKCFLVTIGREWFGIDRLRMDKFMMLVRRCLRQALAFVKDNAWEVGLVEKLTSVVKQDVMMAEARDTSLGFQLHVADVFLEELAKIGADSVTASTVTVFLQPFIEVLVSGKEDRLRDHVAERIFHHLIRQSDPGIEWAVKEEMGDADLNGDEDLEDMEEGKDDDEEDKDDEDDLEADPRAGGVDVTLPQIQVDYQGLAKMLFDLGSGTDVRKANRELLYKLSKNFKDVTQEVFPLAPDLDLDQEIEKISVKKAAKRLEKFNEDYQKKNLENKIAFKSIMKEQKNKQVNDEPLKNGEENGCESSDDLTNGNSNQNGLKRSSEEESDDEPVEKKSKADDNDETEPKEKFDYKEKRRKQKQEQKRRKRERKLKEEAEIAEKEKKAQLLLENDLNFKIALDGEKKTTEVKSTDSEVKVVTPVVADSVAAVELNGIEPAIAVENVLLDEKKEKPKKKKKKVKCDKVTQNGDVSDLTTTVQAVDVQQSESIVKKKKKKKDKEKEKASKENKSDEVQIKSDAIESEPAHVETSTASQTEAQMVKKKKIKDKFRELAKGDESDVTVQDDSCSATEILKKKKKKKRDKSKKLGSEGSDEKVEENGGNLIVGGDELSAKVFEESDWDSPLKPGEVEVVLPNKKYKGKDKLKPADEAQEGFPGFDPPSISKTTPKTSGTKTASFLKKAMSKSVSPKLKKSKLEKLKKLETLTMSEPKKKKVNFALTMNKAQDINAFITSIASSPSIPHDPNKQPSKPLLSGQHSTPESTKRNSVALNTQINSKSKTAKKLGALSKKKLRAMDFF